MLAAGKWITAIVAGGVCMGLLLGNAVDPSVKSPPEEWWQLGRAQLEQPQVYGSPDLGPQLAYAPHGFRPDLDYDAEVWSLPLSELDTTVLAWDEPLVSSAPAEQAASEAAAAVAEALAAAADEPRPDEPRKSALALAGLY